MTLLEAFKKLNLIETVEELDLEEEINLEEEIDPNLYANYVDTLPIFIDVLENGHIKANFDQRTIGGKDWDVRGNHICLTQDIINPPRIMKALQFGVVFDKKRFIDVANHKKGLGITKSADLEYGVKNTTGDVVVPHDDALYRMTYNQVINHVKNKSAGMDLIGIIQYKNGNRSVIFNNWTERFFPNEDNLKINDIEMTEELLEASDSLWNKIVTCFDYYPETKLNNGGLTLYRLGSAQTSKKDFENQLKGYPNFDSEVVDYAYTIGRIMTNNNILGCRMSDSKASPGEYGLHFSTQILNNSETDLKLNHSIYTGKLNGLTKKTIDKNGLSQLDIQLLEFKKVVELTENEITVLCKMILPEHEFRLYLHNITMDELSTSELQQLFKDKKMGTDKFIKNIKDNPKAFYKFNDENFENCVTRIILPDIYRIPTSKNLSVPVKFKEAFLNINSDSDIYTNKLTWLQIRDILIEKHYSEDVVANFIRICQKLDTNSDVYLSLVLKYWGSEADPIIPVSVSSLQGHNQNRDIKIRFSWAKNIIIPFLEDLIKLKQIILEKYPQVKTNNISFYKVYIKNNERFTEYSDTDWKNVYDNQNNFGIN